MIAILKTKYIRMILLTYGTRSEYTKLAPLIEVFDVVDFPYRLLHIGTYEGHIYQEWDYEVRIEYDNNRNRLDHILSDVTRSCIIDEILKACNIELILVQGDSPSSVAIALSAFNHGIRVVHLGAGQRTYDSTPWPEENYRRIISQISSIHLCPTVGNKNNLLDENIRGECYVTGSIEMDNLVPYLAHLEYGNQVIVILQRRENNKLFGLLCSQVEELAIEHPELEFVFPMHNSPEIRKHATVFKKVKVVDLMTHDELMYSAAKARMVITDSGALEEVCSFFNKKCIVCRRTTEHKESIGKSSFLVTDDLKITFAQHVNDYEIGYACPYGDGVSAPKILRVLSNYVNSR